ncbi:MAG: mannosyltransferase family protein [Nocardioidaceae bacterium]
MAGNMAAQASSRVLALPRRAVAAARASDAVRSALAVVLLSRAMVLAVAVFAALSLGPPGAGGLGERNAARFDAPALTHPLGGFGDLLLSPLARWDAVWYLSIADAGYGEGGRAAFFPLYPLLVRGVAALGGGSRGAALVAAFLVSLAAFLAALVLLHRLVSLELGRRLARPTLLLLALFPGSLWFGAPYSESVFLLLSVGAFYAARSGRWSWAGLAAAGASGTRSAGVLLALPLLVLYLYGPRADGAPAPARPPGGAAKRGAARRASALIAPLRPRYRLEADAAWLLLAPLGIAAFALHLELAHGDGLAFLDVQGFWYRHFAGPLGGAWDGVVAAVDGARQLLSGAREPVYFEQAGGDPFRVAGINLMLFGFLVFALVACVGVVRRLPPAYGAWCVTALALPLSFPVAPQPLMSLPRFLAVLFPIFMWLALVCEERDWTASTAGAFAAGLGLFAAQFATWHFVA